MVENFIMRGSGSILYLIVFSISHLSWAQAFYKGHDLSSLKLLEDGGTIYKDTQESNATRPAEDILKDGGMNTVRLRTWVNPQYGLYDLNYTLDLASRFAAKDLSIYLDFHFSDTWADPSHQYTPAAWSTTNLTSLQESLRSYVSSTLEAFHAANVPLAFVSLGNEIRNGMLWPLGQADPTINDASRFTNFTNLAMLYKSARSGVDDAVSATGMTKPSVMIHIDNGWDFDLQEAWFTGITGENIVTTADWDVFAFSFYPFYGTNATLANLNYSLQTLAQLYSKPMHVVETDWPEECSGASAPALSEPSIPVSVQGQVQWVQDIIDVVKSAPNGLGQGVHYWEPTWLNNTGLGSACQDTILFSGDYSNPAQTIGYSRASVDMYLND